MMHKNLIIAAGTTAFAVALAASLWPNHPESDVGDSLVPVKDPAVRSSIIETIAGKGRRTSAGPVDDEALAQVIEQLKALRGDLGTLFEQQRDLRKDLDALAARETVQELAPAEHPVEPSDQTDQQLTLHQSYLEQLVEVEPVDVEWAQQTVASIEQGLQHEDLAGIHLVDATCGSTLCQVNLAIEESLPVDEGMQRLAMHRNWDGPTFFAVDASGEVRLYFARDGYELPEMPELEDPAAL